MVSLERGPPGLFIKHVSIFFVCIKNKDIPDILKPRHILYQTRLTLCLITFVYTARTDCERAVQANHL